MERYDIPLEYSNNWGNDLCDHLMMTSHCNDDSYDLSTPPSIPEERQAIEEFITNSLECSLLFNPIEDPHPKNDTYMTIPNVNNNLQQSFPSDSPIGYLPQFATQQGNNNNNPHATWIDTVWQQFSSFLNDNNRIAIPSLASRTDFLDISLYCRLPMRKAAKQIGVPCSTLGKRWKHATMGRLWPYRRVKKLEKEIEMLVCNLSGGISPQEHANLLYLLNEIKKELHPVYLKVSPKADLQA